jgi:hypothetical protein
VSVGRQAHIRKAAFAVAEYAEEYAAEWPGHAVSHVRVLQEVPRWVVGHTLAHYHPRTGGQQAEERRRMRRERRRETARKSPEDRRRLPSGRGGCCHLRRIFHRRASGKCCGPQEELEEHAAEEVWEQRAVQRRPGREY